MPSFRGMDFDRVLVKTVAGFGMRRGGQPGQGCRCEQGLLARLGKISGLLFVFTFDRAAAWGLGHSLADHTLAVSPFPARTLCTCGFLLHAFFLAMQRFSYPIILPDAFAGFSRDRHIGSLLFPRNLRTVDATSPAQGNFLVSRGRRRQLTLDWTRAFGALIPSVRASTSRFASRIR